MQKRSKQYQQNKFLKPKLSLQAKVIVKFLTLQISMLHNQLILQTYISDEGITIYRIYS